jgi:hypothetical protein
MTGRPRKKERKRKVKIRPTTRSIGPIRFGLCREEIEKLFEFKSRFFSSNKKHFKLNLNWVQNRINSNKFFWELFKSEILEFGLNVQI